MRRFHSAFFSLLVLLATPFALAQSDPPNTSSTPSHQTSGLTGSFNNGTKAFHYLYVANPHLGLTPAACKFLNTAISNPGAEPQQYLAEYWSAPNSGGPGTNTFLLGSGVVTIPGDSKDFFGNSYSVGPTGCSTTGGFFTIKVYSTSASLSISTTLNNGNPDSAYPGSTPAGLIWLHSGDFQRSVMTSSFSFGSSVGVCATLPENSIKVSASNVFPGSPVFGSFGWLNSGTASNSDTCSNNAYSDLFLRASANVSGAGKWTFVYQVPNGMYDIIILYNTVGSGTAGPTVITLNGRTVVNGVSDAPGNLEAFDGRVNVGGNQLLVGVSSPSGTAVLNGVIITPVPK